MAKMKMPVSKAGKKIPGLLVLLSFFLLALPSFSSQEEFRGIVTGQFIDKGNGEGIPGVIVKIYSQGQVQAREKTDKNGEFTAKRVRPGKIVMKFDAPEPYPMRLLNQVWDEFLLEKEKNLHIIKKLPKCATIQGRVLEKNTNEMLKVERALVLYLYARLTVSKDVVGEYRINRIPPGKHTLCLAPHGFGPRKIQNFEIFTGEHKQMDFFFDKNAPNRVKGYVKCDKTGTPYDGLKVMLYSRELDMRVSSITGSSGEYSFYDLLPGEYEVFFSALDTKKKIKVFKKEVNVRGNPVIVDFSITCDLNYKYTVKDLL